MLCTQLLTPEAPTFMLKPDFANVHAFTAACDTIVLDVLLPPYDESRGRDCHYFSPVGGAASDSDQAHLRITAAPADLLIRSGIYRGPVVTLPSNSLEGEPKS